MRNVGIVAKRTKVIVMVLFVAAVLWLGASFTMLVPKRVGAVSLATIDLVSVETADITPRVSIDREADKVTVGGILIESDVEYKGAFNGIFMGETTILFEFPTSDPFSVGENEFRFKVIDAGDPENWFIVRYYTGDQWGSGAFTNVAVGYDLNKNGEIDANEYRTSRYWGTQWYDYAVTGSETAYASPHFSGHNTAGGESSTIRIYWSENDQLVIESMENSGQWGRTIAMFDGTETFVSGTSWGLPDLSSFKTNGYRIEFDSVTGENVCFSEIRAQEGTVDLKHETLETTPEFYTRANSVPKITVDTTPLVSVVDSEVTVPTASVSFAGQTQDPYDVTVNGPGFENLSIKTTMKFTPAEAGTYTIKYQGIENYSHTGEGINPNFVTIQCIVYKNIGAEKLLTENENVSINSGKLNTSIGEDKKGLGVTFNQQGNVSVKFAAIFEGDFSLNLQADINSLQYSFNSVTVRFADVNNSQEYVDVKLVPGIASWANYYTHMLVEYKGEQYTTSYNNPDNVWDTTEIKNKSYTDTEWGNGWYEQAGMTGNLQITQCAADNRVPWGTGLVSFDSNTLSFKTSNNSDPYTVASFTDEKYHWSNTFDGFKNGYTVEIIADVVTQGATLTFTQINSVSLEETYLLADTGESESVLNGEAYQEYEQSNAPYEDLGARLYTAIQTDEGLEFSFFEKNLTEYTITFNDLPADKIDLTKVGTYKLTFEGGAVRTVIVTEDKTAPELSWASGNGEKVTVDNKEDIVITVDDVYGVDTLDGIIAAVITAKAPDSQEYVMYSPEMFSRCGEYTIRYTVTDKAGNVAILERVVELIHRYSGWIQDEEKETHSRSCLNCGNKEIKDCSYDEGTITTEATCTDSGIKTYTCLVCEGTKTETIAALGHTGGTANCHSKAVCIRCSQEYGEVDLDNHDGETEVRNIEEATCTEEGYTGDTYCMGCNNKLTSGQAIMALGHTGGKANCHSKAVCIRCSQEYGDVDADNHEGGTEIRDAVEPTATETGYTGDTYCQGCGAKLADGENIAALGYNVQVANGSIKGQSDTSFNAPNGTKVTVIANAPDKGQVFKGWYDGNKLVSEDTEYTFTLSDNISLIAQYEDEGSGCGSSIAYLSIKGASVVILAAAIFIVVLRKKQVNK